MPCIVREVSAIFVAITTFLEPGGAASNILVCISLGRAEYTGRIINSGTSGPRDFILSYNISQAVSISS
uniref:Putative secreted protein n=1 Tax=Panstrongylus lignarius TaxID=156445 RepID=A0A224XUR6_9HEMI